MSAFFCSEDTLKLIAIWATRRHSGGDDLDAATGAYRILRDANAAALRDRYGDSNNFDHPTNDSVTPSDAMRLARHKPIVVIKQTDCYEYQSCEWRDWTGSEADRLNQQARARATYRLPGYEEAKWGL